MNDTLVPELDWLHSLTQGLRLAARSAARLFDSQLMDAHQLARVPGAVDAWHELRDQG